MIPHKPYNLSKFDLQGLWGEIPNHQELRTITPDVCEALTRASITYANPKETLLDLLKQHPELEEENYGEKLVTENYPVDEVVRHTIRLKLYAKRVKRLIRNVSAKKKAYTGPCMKKLRKVPEMIVKKKDKQSDKYSFILGQAPPLPTLDQDAIHKMLEKAVIIILAEAGFDKTKQSALNVLVDLAKETLMKICNFCHVYSQNDLSAGRVAYNDVLEKSLRSSGFDGVLSIKDYYKNRVLYKRDKALEHARDLLKQYRSLLTQYGLNKTDDKIPEIHFPASGRQENSDALLEILKPGYKMLQTLDQETLEINSEHSNSQPNSPQEGTSSQHMEE